VNDTDEARALLDSLRGHGIVFALDGDALTFNAESNAAPTDVMRAAILKHRDVIKAILRSERPAEATPTAIIDPGPVGDRDCPLPPPTSQDATDGELFRRGLRPSRIRLVRATLAGQGELAGRDGTRED